jgi:Ras family
LASRESYDRIFSYWMPSIEAFRSQHCPLVIVIGNKADTEEELRQVTYGEAVAMAFQHRASYVEACAFEDIQHIRSALAGAWCDHAMGQGEEEEGVEEVDETM